MLIDGCIYRETKSDSFFLTVRRSSRVNLSMSNTKHSHQIKTCLTTSPKFHAVVVHKMNLAPKNRIRFALTPHDCENADW